MVAWVPWVVAGALAVVVLGFCGYELAWKTRRLRADAARLQELRSRATELQAALLAEQRRAADLGRD